MTSEQELKQKMERFNIRERDIKESFIRSSGPGGQNVNKVSTCVALHHLPSGIKVKYQKERSQALNRFKARVLLVEKIEKKKRDERLKKIHAAQKKKRQKRKRSKASKEKMLQNKKKQSEKKGLRRKVNLRKLDQY